MTGEVGRRKWVWHNDPPRFKTRRLKSGKFLFYYRAPDREIPLGSNRVVALEEWSRIEGGAIGSRFPQITKLYRRSDAFKALHPSTQAHYEIALANLDLSFRLATLEQIEPRHVKDYIRRRSKKGAAVFEKKVGSAFFNWAREEGHTKAANPFHGVKFSKAERRGMPTGRRKVYVTDDMYRAVWDRAAPVLQDAMDLAYYTGQRVGDVLKARRQDIVDGVLWIVQEKTGATVGVRVEGELQRVLQRIQERPRAVSSVYLICDRRGQRIPRRTLNARFIAARGEERWQFRDIRAKTASDMPNLKKAQLLLGHANETTTNIYRRADGVVAPLERKIRDVS